MSAETKLSNVFFEPYSFKKVNEICKHIYCIGNMWNVIFHFSAYVIEFQNPAMGYLDCSFFSFSFKI